MMKYIYIVLLVAVIIAVIVLINKRLIKSHTQSNQLNIISESKDVELSINVDEMHELKRRVFETFSKEKNLKITTADYEVSFDKTLLNAIKINKIDKELESENKSTVESLNIEDSSDDQVPPAISEQEIEMMGLDQDIDNDEQAYLINGDHE